MTIATLRRGALAACLALGPGLALGSGFAGAEPLTLTLAGASPGGLWSLIGVGVDRALAAAEPGSTVTYQTSGGGYANIRMLDEGLVDMAILHDAEAARAAAGEEPFAAPVGSVRALAVMYDFSALQPLVAAEFLDRHGIASFADLREKRPPLRLALNKRGNITFDLAVAVLEANGITLADIESWGGTVVTAGSKEGAEMMMNRQADMTMNAPFVGHSSILEVANAIPVRILPVPEAAIEAVSARMGTGQTVIPAAAYDFLDRDLPTPALAALIAVDAGMDAARAERITAAMIAGIGELRGVHAAMAALTPGMMTAQRAIPFHAGAEAAFRAAGLM